MEAKSDYRNGLCAHLARYNASHTMPVHFRQPRVHKDGDKYIFTFQVNDMAKIAKADKIAKNKAAKKPDVEPITESTESTEEITDEEVRDFLARNYYIILSMKWDVGKGKGYLVKTTKMYINGKLYRESDHTPFPPKYVDKQLYQSERNIELYHLLDCKERIEEIRLEVEGAMDATANFFPLELLDERIRPFYAILKREAERYFRDEITLEQCMIDLRESYLALPKYTS
jgi:hypothetical protein